ncbi:protein phosphatase 2C domain-containing protein [uncultured Pseudosulfitobacter sp.]|uniref:PP2C family protein-serine/threonine phosphatase n=1 Tax=uncultured Pseudosulfitobacter sp. TaxID=2854214 RepID=UPI0030D87A51|tara:strand:+ start:753 stop:1451 length:699 start_codon:yes stop_codon:yes gene_type:complete
MKFRKLSITGPKGENQDVVLEPFQVGDTTWCGIADGVGSAALGGMAARAGLDEVRGMTDAEPMGELFARVSRKLATLAEQHGNPKSLSTTLSLLCIEGDKANVGHVGDTRITHYRGGGVMTRTKDQTEVQKLLDDGVLTKNQARRYPRRNVLLSAMSAGREYDLHEATFSLEVGDRVLLTSDGFHGKLLRPQLASLSAATPDFDEFWRALEEKLSVESMEDDASCLAIEIDP